MVLYILHLTHLINLFQAGTALQSTGYDITDQDTGDTKTFSFDCGTITLTGYFIIDTSTGIMSFSTDYDVDVSQPTSVSCTITVTDSGGLTGTATLDITISEYSISMVLK